MENHLLSVITYSISHSPCLIIKRKKKKAAVSCIGDFATYLIKCIEYIISLLTEGDVLPCKLQGCPMDKQVK